VFWLNVPLVAAALAAVLTVVPRDHDDAAAPAGRLDLRGTALGACTLAACTVGLIEGGRTGWSPAVTLPAAAGTAALAVTFVRTERRHPAPMLPPALFRDRRFTVANAAAAAMNLVGIGTLFVVTLYLQDVRRLTPLRTGVALLPMFAPVAALAPVAGRLTARYGPRRPAVCGLLLGAAGTAESEGGRKLPTSSRAPSRGAQLRGSTRAARAGRGLPRLPGTPQQSCCRFALFPWLRCSSPGARVWCLRGPLGIFFAPQLTAVCHRLSHNIDRLGVIVSE
jgi:hypothetical protein